MTLLDVAFGLFLAFAAGASTVCMTASWIWYAVGFASSGTGGILMAAAALACVAVGAGVSAPRGVTPLKVFALAMLVHTAGGLLGSPLTTGARALDGWLLAGLGGGPLRAAGDLVLWMLPLALPFGALGAALPQLAAHLRTRGAQAGRAPGMVLAAWAAGAAVASVWAGAWIIPTLGIELAGLMGTAIGAVSGMFALAAEACGVGQPAWGAGPQDVRTGPGVEVSGGMAAVCAFLCGLSALATASSLHRVITVAVGATAYLMPLELSALFTVTALAAAVAAVRAARARAPWADLASALAASGLVLLVCLPLDARLPQLLTGLRGWLPGAVRGFHTISWLIVLAVVAPCGLALGVVWPLLATTARPREEELQVARALRWLSGGGAVGAFVAALLMHTGLGHRTGLRFGGSLALAAGLVLLWRDPAAPLRRGPLALLGLCVVCIYVASPPDLGEHRIPLGAARAASITAKAPAGKVVWSEEDGATLVTVDRQQNGVYSLRADGVLVGTSGDDRRGQKLLAHLPLLLHPAPRRVLMLGRGTGLALTSALSHPVEVVEVVEPSLAMVRAATLFHDVSSFQPARVLERAEDPRAFLRRAKDLFDVILVDAPRQWLARSANLWSREGLDAIRQHLTADGRVALRLAFTDLDSVTFQVLVRTVCDTFPQVDVFRVGPAELVVVAAVKPASCDLDAFARRVAHPAVAADLETAGAGLTSPRVLLGHQLTATRRINELGGLGPVETDMMPLGAFLAARALFSSAELGFTDRNARSGDPENLLGQELRAHPPGADDLVALVRGVPELTGELREAFLRDALATEPSHVPARLELARSYRDSGDSAAALEIAQEAAALKPRSYEAWELVFEIAFSREGASAVLGHRRTYVLALAAARRQVEIDPDQWLGHASLGHVYSELEEHKRAFDAFARALMLLSSNTAAAEEHLRTVLTMMANARAGMGDLRGARALLERSDRAPGHPCKAFALEAHLRVRLATAEEIN